MSNCADASQAIPVLTEQDVAAQLASLLAHGYGKLEIEVYAGYIRVIRPQPTILGRAPTT